MEPMDAQPAVPEQRDGGSSKSSTPSNASTNPPPSTDNLEEVDGALVRRDENGFQYFTCRFCGLTFNYINTLRAHERVHNVETPFVCGKCGECFHFACELEYHSMQHTSVSGYKCECGRTFFSYTELLYHRHADEDPAPKRVVESLRPVSQPLHQPSTSSALPPNPPAPAEYPVPAFMQEGFEPKHPMKVYKDVRTNPYICEYCSKSYPDSRQLAYHMYSHRGERNFNPRSSRYLMGRGNDTVGVGYTDRPVLRY